MKSFIESLESRTLLSAAGNLVAEGKLVKSDLVVYGKTGVDNYKLVYADLKAADSVKANKGLLKTLGIEGVSGFKSTSGAVKSTETLIAGDLSKVVSAAKALAKHPTSAAAVAKLTAAKGKLSLDASNKLTVIDNDIAFEKTTNSTNLTNIETANATNTQLATDITTTIEPRTTAARTTLLDDVSTALATDVPAVVAAYPT